jgi:RNA polymerase sigma-70 factor, ECF subfamily
MALNEDKQFSIEDMIEAYGNDVLKISFMYLKDRQLAEDAFQEVFLKVYKKYDSFREESSLKTWIISITINVCKDMLKTSWFKRVQTVSDEVLHLVSDEGYEIEDELLRKELFLSVLNLPTKYKDVLILYYYQGYQISEIADMLKTTTGNVSSLLSRARKMLKSSLNER